MFESAELGRKLGKGEYKTVVPQLRTELLAAQRALVSADFPLLILLNGVEGAGKGHALNLLHEWMDARLIRAHALGAPDQHQASFPEYWRFWMSLPAAGTTAIYVGNWYTAPILDAAFGRSDQAKFELQLARINDFERQLVSDGALILKFWFHLSKKVQKRRIKDLARDPEQAWRVTKRDRKYLKHYGVLRSASERAIRETSTGQAPWTVIEGQDRRYRSVAMGQHVLEQLTARLKKRPGSGARESKPSVLGNSGITILNQLDLTKSLSPSKYEHELAHWQGRLAQAARAADKHGVRMTVVFEGWDAGGKGGAIRRLIHPLDARQYRIIPIAAPTDEERSRHYLWRFWRHLPGPGRITIYDRSWYGRVLVERVEGFASEDEWRRAYREINEFEEQLVESDIVLVKFWLHISPDEQLRRFEEREQIPWKRHKITPEDYRNREKAPAYEAAVDEMVARTSTEFAPWTLVEAESKHFARVKVVRTVCEALRRCL